MLLVSCTIFGKLGSPNAILYKLGRAQRRGSGEGDEARPEDRCSILLDAGLTDIARWVRA